MDISVFPVVLFFPELGQRVSGRCREPGETRRSVRHAEKNQRFGHPPGRHHFSGTQYCVETILQSLGPVAFSDTVHLKTQYIFDFQFRLYFLLFTQKPGNIFSLY